MYLRRDKKRLTDGAEVTYVSLAHNVVERPVGGKKKPRSKPVIFANLGREDALDDGVVRGMRDALDRYLQRRARERGESVSDAVAPDAVKSLSPALKLLASRDFGLRKLIEPIWEAVGLRAALEEIEQGHQVSFPFERVVFAMVLNRLIDPRSKRACNDWLEAEAWFPEAEGWQVQHFYRSMDLLDAHLDEVMAAIGRAARAAVPEESLSLILIDTTSSYFESDLDDVERHGIAEEWVAFDAGDGPQPGEPRPQVVNDPPMRMRGHSKDHRPREPQVKVGLCTGANGELVHVEVVPGNTSDQRLTLGLVHQARAALGGLRLAVAMDSGMGGGPNLRALDELEPPMDRVSAVPLRLSKFAEDNLLAKAGRWAKHPYKPGWNYRVLEVDADASPSKRAEVWIATRNGPEARRQRRLLDKEVARVTEALAQDSRVDGHGHPVCKLLANPKRRRLVRVASRGNHLVLDRDRIRIERRRAGVHVIRSTVTDLPAEASLRAYDTQRGIEDQFRMCKGPLRLRPMHHRAERRIRAHVVICVLALMVLRELERRTGRHFHDLKKLFAPVRAVHVEQGNLTFWQREAWSPEAAAVLEQLEIGQGPVAWGSKTTSG